MISFKGQNKLWSEIKNKELKNWNFEKDNNHIHMAR
jgi:hypothetical protein